jgi:beta-galactosidase
MKKFDFSIVKNPELFEQNSLPPHSDHEYYSCEEAAERGLSDYKFILNGQWKFSYAVNPESAPRDFFKDDVDCRDWDDIKVPAHIQMEGYDVPQYSNVEYPWDGHENVEPGMVPTHFNPTASYVKYFTIPDNFKGRPLFISFQGVESAMALWMNGEYVGYREDSFTPSEFDLTPFVRDGENKLAVRVFKWCAGSWCEDQDFFRFSGIFRDVYLYTIPDVHLKDLKVKTLLNDDYTNADLDLGMKFTGKGSYKIRLIDMDGVDFITGDGPFDKKLDIVIPVQQPELWSAEKPYLYTLEIKVLDEDDRLQEIIREEVGFRSFEMKNNIMCINGKRIVFRGVDRHEFGSKAGRVITEKEIKKDIVVMKQNNINAIRTSHYPNRTELYRLCDEYGMYVIDETNLETHGTWDVIASGAAGDDFAVPGDRKEYMELILDRARNMYERDKNHACILIWSCGNESYGGKDIFEMSNAFRKWDPTRLVHYEGVAHDTRYPDTTDMISTMYAPTDSIREFLKTNRNKPYICCEYAHSMGNSTGALYKYTELTREEPLYQGGFIWDYIDQSLDKVDRYGRKFQGYGGDSGERPTDYNFSGNGIVYGDTREPSPKMQEVKYDYQPILVDVKEDEFKVTNEFLFTNTSDFVCKILLEKDGEFVEEYTMEAAVAPGKEKVFELPVEIPDKPGEYVTTVSFELKEDTEWAKAGHEVAYGQKIVDKSANDCIHGGKIRVTEGYHNIGVKGDGFEVLFSKVHGGMSSYTYCGTQYIMGIPKPNFWRATTDNDRGNLQPFRSGQWRNASQFATIYGNHGYQKTDYEYDIQEDKVIVKYTYHLPVVPERDCVVTYTVFSDGEVGVKMYMDESREVGELPEMSMMFKMPYELQNLEWYGPGPEETYIDRPAGKIGIHRNTVKDNVARYLVPQESGFKIEVRYARLTDAVGKGIEFRCNKHGFSALPNSPEETEAAQHQNELPEQLYTYVRVGEQMGVGGDDSWGALVHPEYLLPNDKPMEIEFSFKGIM